jgi:DNA-binding XRE family transcriptional regulator
VARGRYGRRQRRQEDRRAAKAIRRLYRGPEAGQPPRLVETTADVIGFKESDVTTIDLNQVTDGDLRALLKDLRASGDLTDITLRGSGHLGLTLRSGQTMVVPSTNSDHRGLDKMKSRLRRFGVDVPHRGEGRTGPRRGVPQSARLQPPAPGWPTLLREARTRAGVTQDDTGRLLKPPVSGSAIGLWEIGKVHPRPAARAQINDIFGIKEEPVAVTVPEQQAAVPLTPGLAAVEAEDTAAREGGAPVAYVRPVPAPAPTEVEVVEVQVPAAVIDAAGLVARNIYLEAWRAGYDAGVGTGDVAALEAQADRDAQAHAEALADAAREAGRLGDLLAEARRERDEARGHLAAVRKALGFSIEEAG